MPLLAALLLAGAQAAAECSGCHTESRAAPLSRFDVGLGRWTEESCFGCHLEMTDVAREGILFGRKDARYFALPLSEEKRLAIAAEPLSFLSAPEDVALTAGAFFRIDARRLLDFLRRPADARRSPGEADRMLAYPSLTWDDIPEVMRAVSGEPGPASTGVCEAPPRDPGAMEDTAANGAAYGAADSAPPGEPRSPSEVWETRCRNCHEDATSAAGRPPSYLALFTPEWIHAYSNGLAGIEGRGARAMPIAPISRAAAEELYAYFGERRREKEAEVDRRVQRIDWRDAERRTSGRALSEAERTFVWSRFLREGKCVHCHAAEGQRATAHFAATAWGLRRYVRKAGGMALWRRLEVRAIEAEMGITAQAPGMPMASLPLSAELRDLIYVWVRDGCRTRSGRRECVPLNTFSK